VAPVVNVNVGLKAPHTTFTDALLETAASLAPCTKAMFLAVHGQVPAVTQYCRAPHWFICMVPTFHCMVRVPEVHVPIRGWAVDVTNPPKFRQAGKESVTTTPSTSRPGMGPLPKTLRHV
jgi:hypothetical protein